jgi:diacylglycerol kinase family enzyme
MRRRFFIVHNPTAGVPRHGFFTAVLSALLARGAIVTVFEHPDPATAANAVREALHGYDAIVAAGGDGTARRVAAMIGDAAVPLGLIPLGTGNVLAREIGQRRRPADVAATLLDGPVATIHGARANGEPFYLMAGVGFDGRAVAFLDQRLKRLLGRAAYASAVIRAWRAPADQLDVEVDGSRYRANWLIVTNARHYGGGFVLTPRGSVFSPGLEAILVNAPHRFRLTWQMLRLAGGRLADMDNPHVTAMAAARIVVTASTPVPVQLDGDRFGGTPVTIDANGPQLRLIVPR